MVRLGFLLGWPSIRFPPHGRARRRRGGRRRRRREGRHWKSGTRRCTTAGRTTPIPFVVCLPRMLAFGTSHREPVWYRPHWKRTTWEEQPPPPSTTGVAWGLRWTLQMPSGLLHTSLRPLHQLQARACVGQILRPSSRTGGGHASRFGTGRGRGSGGIAPAPWYTPIEGASSSSSSTVHAGTSKAHRGEGAGHWCDRLVRKRLHARRGSHHPAARGRAGSGGSSGKRWAARVRPQRGMLQQRAAEGGAKQIHRWDLHLALRVGGEGR